MIIRVRTKVIDEKLIARSMYILLVQKILKDRDEHLDYKNLGRYVPW
jgi:hypothetical protein